MKKLIPFKDIETREQLLTRVQELQEVGAIHRHFLKDFPQAEKFLSLGIWIEPIRSNFLSETRENDQQFCVLVRYCLTHGATNKIYYL